MMAQKQLWVDGRILPAEHATASVMSHALHYAGAVYEGVRVYGGRAFELDRHVSRLVASAEHLGFGLPLDGRRICLEIDSYLAVLHVSDCYLRIIAWSGEALGLGGEEAPVHLAFAAAVWPAPFATRDGIDLSWSQWRRPAPDTVPVLAKCSTVYTIGTLAAQEARQAGADDALFTTHDGRLADVTGANVFLVFGSTLVTPIADTFLGGITRRTILNGAESLSLRSEERHVQPSEVFEADEAFVCGTAYEVVPVRSVDGRVLPKTDIGRTVQQWYLETVHDR
jgi:branched-chain amino acid aminotransferase